MGKRLTLILGGARSGKSDWAQTLAQRRGGQEVLFLATAQAGDDEMRARIAAHRTARPAGWQTVEAPRAPAAALRGAAGARVVLLDCVTLWTSNVMLADEERAEQALYGELEDLLGWYSSADAELIIVSNEVGMGVVPPYELGRLYRDLLGSINKRLAAAADDVFWLVAGLPVEIKALARALRESRGAAGTDPMSSI